MSRKKVVTKDLRSTDPVIAELLLSAVARRLGVPKPQFDTSKISVFRQAPPQPTGDPLQDALAENAYLRQRNTDLEHMVDLANAVEAYAHELAYTLAWETAPEFAKLKRQGRPQQLIKNLQLIADVIAEARRHGNRNIAASCERLCESQPHRLRYSKTSDDLLKRNYYRALDANPMLLDANGELREDEMLEKLVQRFSLKPNGENGLDI